MADRAGVNRRMPARERAAGPGAGHRYHPPISSDEFDEEYFARLSQARHHWWVRGMVDLAARMVGPIPTGTRVLDLGCGSGANFDWLNGEGARLQGTDLSPAALAFCRALPAGSPPLTCSTITHLPYASGSFDLVVNADVLQHIDAARAVEALREIRRVLVPGGRLFVRTNAAFGRAGVAVRDDWRLYRPATLRAELKSAGFSVARLTHANAIPALVATIRHRLPRARPTGHDHHDHEHHDHEHRPHESTEAGLGIPEGSTTGWRDQVSRALLGLEARWLAGTGRTVRFGHSLVAVAVADT